MDLDLTVRGNSLGGSDAGLELGTVSLLNSIHPL